MCQPRKTSPFYEYTMIDTTRQHDMVDTHCARAATSKDESAYLAPLIQIRKRWIARDTVSGGIVRKKWWVCSICSCVGRLRRSIEIWRCTSQIHTVSSLCKI